MTSQLLRKHVQGLFLEFIDFNKACSILPSALVQSSDLEPIPQPPPQGWGAPRPFGKVFLGCRYPP